MKRMVLVGLVLSILWAIGASIYQRNSDVDKAEFQSSFAARICLNGHNPNPATCEAERTSTHDLFMKGSWGNVGFIALVPIPFFWLFGFILLYVGRVQVAGFHEVVPWRNLTTPKRAFVVFCTLSGGLTIVAAGVVVMNLYVDTQVTVIPGSEVMVIETGEYVTAKGTWVRSEQITGSSSIGDPLQTSEITCYKSLHRCTEARGLVSGNVLMVEAQDHDIASWTADSIVLRDEASCATETFTIDLRTKVVSGVGELTHQDEKYCKSFLIASHPEQHWSYRMENGFKVYWELRNKARPWPLRVLHAMFGN